MSWNETAIKHGGNILLGKEIKQLLINRGENMKKLKISKKMDLIEHLKKNHCVKLKQPLNNLTKKQLLIELTLFNLFDKSNNSLTKQKLITKLETTMSNFDENKTEESSLPIIEWSRIEPLGSIKERFDLNEIKQLFVNRGAKQTEIKGNINELTQLLKDKYTVNLYVPLTCLTIKQIQLELKLHCKDSHNYGSGKGKQDLINRLKAAISEKICNRFYIHLHQKSIGFFSKSSNAVRLNYNAFIISDKFNNLYKYNVSENKWIEWIKCPMQYISRGSCINPCICINKLNKLLFVYFHHFESSESRMLKINFETKQHTIIRNAPNYYGKVKLLYINKQIHLFQCEYRKHWILNDKKNKFDLFHESELDMCWYNIIHIPLKNIVLIIGNKKHEIYDINTHKWSVSNININRFEQNYCLSLDQRYLYILDENIKILDLENMAMITSKTRMPSYGGRIYYGIIMPEMLKHELIIFGFVRDCWNKYNIGEDRFPPAYIVKLMQSFCSEEYLHILEWVGNTSWWFRSTGTELLRNDGSYPSQMHVKIRREHVLKYTK